MANATLKLANRTEYRARLFSGRKITVYNAYKIFKQENNQTVQLLAKIHALELSLHKFHTLGIPYLNRMDLTQKGYLLLEHF